MRRLVLATLAVAAVAWVVRARRTPRPAAGPA
jgi:hypothetical protein